MTLSAREILGLPKSGPITITDVVRMTCSRLGHIKAPIYVEEDGNCDDYYCKRCGEQI